MEAVVLAGGFGTRLRHLVSDVPKPMALVAGRPFLEYILDMLDSQGIDRIVLAVGYKKDSIMAHFGNCYKTMEIVYSVEDTPLYTGGAAKRALKKCEGDRVFLVNGDTLFHVSLAALQKMQEEHNADLVIAVKRLQNYDRYGTIIIDGMRIRGFCEKCPMADGWINGGVYYVKRSILEDVPLNAFSFEKDILEVAVNHDIIYACESNGYFIDIGVPDDYLRAQSEFAVIG